MIQVAGAASLGEGRLSRTRLEICRQCFDGTAVADLSVETRLARLLADDGLDVRERSRQAATAWIDKLEPDAREQVVSLLDAVLLHGWQRMRTIVREAHGALDSQPRLQSLLQALAACWARESPRPEHVVLGERMGERLRQRRAGSLEWLSPRERMSLLNGTRALVLE